MDDEDASHRGHHTQKNSTDGVGEDDRYTDSDREDKAIGHDKDGHDSHSKHDEHAHHSPEAFRDKVLAVSLLNIPVLAYSHDIQSWFGFQAPQFPGSEFITFLFGTLIFFYGGNVFIKGALNELRKRLPGMMTLISLAITVAYGYSVMVTFGFPGHAIYWELSTLVLIMLIGHWVEMRSVQGAKGALKELTKLLPDTASRIVDGKEEQVPVSELNIDDVVLIRPGEQVPIDGSVVEGSSYLNESMLTGESKPVAKKVGDTVLAGTLNQDGSLRVKVEKDGDETALAGIMKLVAEAQSSSSRSQRLADRAAFYLTVIALTAAAVTAFAWFLIGEEGVFIIERVVTVLVMTCPHALGLAIPLVIAISVTLSAKGGLLVRDRKALEEAKDIDCVVFDKTGTLTEGEQALVSLRSLDIDEDELLTLAASAEADSEHMIAKALLAAAEERGLKIMRAEGFKNISGVGVVATVGGKEVSVGGSNLLESMDIPKDDSFSEEGHFIVIDGELKGAFTMSDRVRSESKEAVAKLREMGVRVVMLTGDSESVAKEVADELTIDQYFSEVLPEHKSDKVNGLKTEGYKVAMVGDGVNDAPALAAADIGIAIGAGTDVAVESADIVLIRNDPGDVVRLIEISKATYRKMLQNLAWATGYNVVAIPLAAGVLAGSGILLPMAAGALLMSASTVIVAANAQLLRGFDIG